MRINRDIRFSQDKSPYKTNFFSFMSKGGKKSPFGGYYFSVQPGKSFFGGGIYMPGASVLSAIRQEIDYNLSEWEAIVSQPAFIKHFGEVKASRALKTSPRGYSEDNPAIKYLRYKGYYTQKMLSDKELQDPGLTEKIREAYAAVRPLVAFLNRGVEQ